MKNNLKKIIAGIMAGIICIGMTACRENGSENVGEEGDSANQLEEQRDDENNEYEENDDQEEDENVVYAPKKEIIEADFSSGLIQINNDIFQQGGYITAAELYKKHSKKYEISYVNEVGELNDYKKSKDTLIEGATLLGENDSNNEIYEPIRILRLKPKKGSEEYMFNAYVANMTSPDKAITLDETVVLYYKPVSHVETKTPMWLPKGIIREQSFDYGWEMPEGIESENKNYTLAKYIEMIKADGFEAVDNVSKGTGGKYYDESGMATLWAEGEANLFGAKPIFVYKVYDQYGDKDENIDGISCSIQKYERTTIPAKTEETKNSSSEITISTNLKLKASEGRNFEVVPKLESNISDDIALNKVKIDGIETDLVNCTLQDLEDKQTAAGDGRLYSEKNEKHTGGTNRYYFFGEQFTKQRGVAKYHLELVKDNEVVWWYDWEAPHNTYLIKALSSGADIAYPDKRIFTEGVEFYNGIHIGMAKTEIEQLLGKGFEETAIVPVEGTFSYYRNETATMVIQYYTKNDTLIAERITVIVNN